MYIRLGYLYESRGCSCNSFRKSLLFDSKQVEREKHGFPKPSSRRTSASRGQGRHNYREGKALDKSRENTGLRQRNGPRHRHECSVENPSGKRILRKGSHRHRPWESVRVSSHSRRESYRNRKLLQHSRSIKQYLHHHKKC